MLIFYGSLFLRYPLAGFLASLSLDVLHVPLVGFFQKKDLLAGNSFNDYHLLDKWFDLYFLFFALLIVLLFLAAPKLIQEYFFHIEGLRSKEIFNFLLSFQFSKAVPWKIFFKLIP